MDCSRRRATGIVNWMTACENWGSLTAKHGLYTRSDAGERMIVGVYMDDLLVVGDSIENIGKFKEEMMQTFSMSNLGSLSYYLEIEVRQIGDGIELYQKAYAPKILDRVGLRECNGAETPMEACLKL
jgi:hypothetical protein